MTSCEARPAQQERRTGARGRCSRRQSGPRAAAPTCLCRQPPPRGVQAAPQRVTCWGHTTRDGGWLWTLSEEAKTGVRRPGWLWGPRRSWVRTTERNTALVVSISAHPRRRCPRPRDGAERRCRGGGGCAGAARVVVRWVAAETRGGEHICTLSTTACCRRRALPFGSCSRYARPRRPPARGYAPP